LFRWQTVALALFTATLFAPTPAHAGKCDALVNKVPSTDRDQLATLYGEVLACDKTAATESFNSFMRASSETEILVDLSLKAIGSEVYEPVWDMLEQIADYTAREDVARRVGAMCQDNVGVLPFLRGGYYAMNDRAFSMWSESFVTCPSGELTEWLKSEIASPPSRTYDDKYNSLLNSIVKRLGPDALEPLERAAIAASERGGPFTSVIEKMTQAARPGGMGSKMTPEDAARLSAALVRVGQKVQPEQAANVADRLYQTGHTTEAAGLLKYVYGDRVQADGTLLYGVTVTEHCGGEAVVHIAEVHEPSKRWSIQDDVSVVGRQFKQRLKCDTDGPWPVQVTRSPVKSSADIDAFAAEVEAAWTDKNLAVKSRKEKPIILP